MITTATFSAAAKQYVAGIEQRVIRIHGQWFA